MFPYDDYVSFSSADNWGERDNYDGHEEGFPKKKRETRTVFFFSLSWFLISNLFTLLMCSLLLFFGFFLRSFEGVFLVSCLLLLHGFPFYGIDDDDKNGMVLMTSDGKVNLLDLMGKLRQFGLWTKITKLFHFWRLRIVLILPSLHIAPHDFCCFRLQIAERHLLKCLQSHCKACARKQIALSSN